HSCVFKIIFQDLKYKIADNSNVILINRLASLIHRVTSVLRYLTKFTILLMENFYIIRLSIYYYFNTLFTYYFYYSIFTFLKLNHCIKFVSIKYFIKKCQQSLNFVGIFIIY